MKKVPSLVTLSLLVLGLAACNNANDFTGINAGNTPSPSEVGPEAFTRVTDLATGPHKVAVIAPNPLAPVLHKRTPIPTPSPTLRANRSEAPQADVIPYPLSRVLTAAAFEPSQFDY